MLRTTSSQLIDTSRWRRRPAVHGVARQAWTLVDRCLERLLPRSEILAVPSAALAGAALPGCECASVPIAGRLCARGVQPAAALAFMLAAPAVNPVVLVATAVAFPGQPQMVLARFCGSLLTSVTVGLLWSRVADQRWVERARRRVAGAGDGPGGWPSARRPVMTSGTPGAGCTPTWSAPSPRPTHPMSAQSSSAADRHRPPTPVTGGPSPRWFDGGRLSQRGVRCRRVTGDLDTASSCETGGAGRRPAPPP
jgi:hypothetical protein